VSVVERQSSTPLPSAPADVVLSDGRVVRLRPLSTFDAQPLRELNARVSVRTRRLRYFSLSEQPGDWYVEQLLQHVQAQSAVVAEDHGRLVAIGSFEVLEGAPTRAEVGLLVDDAEQHHGVGPALLEHLVQQALAQGVQTLTADVLSENWPMKHLLGRSGWSVRQVGLADGIAELEIDLSRHIPVGIKGPAARDVLPC
jgi:GNAT superfamily N-acetyltransferase